MQTYLTLEVLFASRRFSQDGSQDIVSGRILQSLLNNAEIVQTMTMIDNDGEEVRVKIDKKDEMRVISYMQALSQVIVNISTTKN